MKESQQIPAVHLEGGDGVGKNEAALAVATEYCDAGYNVVFTNYPQYWSFTGTTVREMNREGTDANNFLNSLNPEREAEVRAAMYALDRAFTLSLIQSECDRLGPRTVIVSDRGPYSNIVTTAYMVESGNIPTEEAFGFIKRFVPAIEPEMMALFDIRPVLCLSQSQYDCGGRKSLDQLEAAFEAQSLAVEYYRSTDMPEVVTRMNNGWRDTEDITREIIQKSGIPIPETEPTSTGNLELIGPRALLNGFRINDLPEELRVAIARWEQIQTTPMLENKKIKLDMLEERIAHLTLPLLQHANLDLFSQYPITQIAMNRLVTDYPELIELIEHAIDKNTANFINNIANQSF